jgi:capsular exopolysaccharide synthesis family protein
MMFQQPAPSGESARLEDYLRAVGNRRWLVLAIVALGVGLAVLQTRSGTDTYTASARVVLNPTPAGSVDNRKERPNLDREREVLQSNATAEGAAERLGFGGDPRDLLGGLAVAFQPDSDVLRVSYSGPGATLAAERANAFAGAYVDRREQEAVRFYTDRSRALEERLAQLDAGIAEVNGRIQELDTARVAAQAEPAGPARDSLLASITSDREAARSELNFLTNQKGQAQGQLADLRTTVATEQPIAEVLRDATPPGRPDGLGDVATVVGGLLLGLVAGIVAAFLAERLDDRAKREEDVALALGSSVLGHVPALGLAHRGSASLVMFAGRSSRRVGAAREAYRRLRGSVQYLSVTGDARAVLVTSAFTGEGKSTTAANLAIAAAQSGSRVVLVSADLHRPTIEKILGLDRAPGLVEYLRGTHELNPRTVAGVDGLVIISAGGTSGDGRELFTGTAFTGLVGELRGECDLVIIDTPPVLGSADTAAIAPHVDGALVVVDTRRTETKDLLRVRSELERSGGKVLGAVMNRQRWRRTLLRRRRTDSYYAYAART